MNSEDGYSRRPRDLEHLLSPTRFLNRLGMISILVGPGTGFRGRGEVYTSPSPPHPRGCIRGRIRRLCQTIVWHLIETKVIPLDIRDDAAPLRDEFAQISALRPAPFFDLNSEQNGFRTDLLQVAKRAQTRLGHLVRLRPIFGRQLAFPAVLQPLARRPFHGFDQPRV